MIGTNPPGGATAPRESEIVLTVSDGPAPVRVQDVAGKTYDEAAAALTGQGFKVARNDVFDDKVDVGKVVGTDPSAGQLAARNGTVTVNVSKGPELITVPTNLVGQDRRSGQPDPPAGRPRPRRRELRTRKDRARREPQGRHAGEAGLQGELDPLTPVRSHPRPGVGRTTW